MKARTGLLLVLTGVVMLGGCRSESSRMAKRLQAARDSVGAGIERYQKAVLAQDTALFEYWSPDLVAYQPGRVATAPELRQQLVKTFADYKVARYDVRTSERAAHDSGSVVYAFIEQKQTLQARGVRQEGAAVGSDVASVVRWVRQPDGRYAMDRMITVPRLPDAAALPANDTATPFPKAKPDTAGVRDAVIGAMSRFMEGIVAGKTEVLEPVLSPDVQLVEPGTQAVGRDSVLAALKRLFEQQDIENGATQTLAVYVHDGGQVAYQYGGYSETLRQKLPPLSRQKPMIAEGHFHFLARWERGADGDWRLDRFYATPQPMPQQ